MIGLFREMWLIQTKFAVPETQTTFAFDSRSIDYICAGEQMRCQPAQQFGREPGADAEASLCDQEHQEYEVHRVSSLWGARGTVNGQEVGVLALRVMVLNGENGLLVLYEFLRRSAVLRPSSEGKANLHFQPPVVGVFREALAVQSARGLIGAPEKRRGDVADNRTG